MSAVAAAGVASAANVANVARAKQAPRAAKAASRVRPANPVPAGMSAPAAMRPGSMPAQRRAHATSTHHRLLALRALSVAQGASAANVPKASVARAPSPALPCDQNSLRRPQTGKPLSTPCRWQRALRCRRLRANAKPAAAGAAVAGATATAARFAATRTGLTTALLPRPSTRGPAAVMVMAMANIAGTAPCPQPRWPKVAPPLNAKAVSAKAVSAKTAAVAVAVAATGCAAKGLPTRRPPAAMPRLARLRLPAPRCPPRGPG